MAFSKFCVHFVFQGFYLALLLYGFTLSLRCLTILFYLFIFIYFSAALTTARDFIFSLKVCAVGWEPNPHLTRYLEKLEQSYRKCGYRVIIHKVTLNFILNTILDRPYHKLILNAGNWGWNLQYKVDVWKLKKGNNHILIANSVFSQLSSSSI